MALKLGISRGRGSYAKYWTKETVRYSFRYLFKWLYIKQIAVKKMGVNPNFWIIVRDLTFLGHISGIKGCQNPGFWRIHLGLKEKQDVLKCCGDMSSESFKEKWKSYEELRSETRNWLGCKKRVQSCLLASDSLALRVKCWQ